jgi:hypothetical protein
MSIAPSFTPGLRSFVMGAFGLPGFALLADGSCAGGGAGTADRATGDVIWDGHSGASAAHPMDAMLPNDRIVM